MHVILDCNKWARMRQSLWNEVGEVLVVVLGPIHMLSIGKGCKVDKERNREGGKSAKQKWINFVFVVCILVVLIEDVSLFLSKCGVRNRGQ